VFALLRELYSLTGFWHNVKLTENLLLLSNRSMKSFSYTEARDHLKHLMDQVNENHAPLYIQRRNGGGAVLMAESDYAGLQETLYLLGNPANAERLLAARHRSREDGIPWEDAKERLGL